MWKIRQNKHFKELSLTLKEVLDLGSLTNYKGAALSLCSPAGSGQVIHVLLIFAGGVLSAWAGEAARCRVSRAEGQGLCGTQRECSQLPSRAARAFPFSPWWIKRSLGLGSQSRCCILARPDL